MTKIEKYLEKNLQSRYFVVSLSLPNSYDFIAKYIYNYAIRRIPAICSFGIIAVWRQKGVRPLFVHINQLFLAKCQTAKQQVSIRRTVRSLHTLHPSTRCRNHNSLRLLYNLQNGCIMKNSAKNFVKSKTLRTFVSANVAISNKIRYILNRIIAGFLRHYRACCGIARLPKHKEPRFFCLYTLINFCFSQWQTWTKAYGRYKVLATHRLHPSTRCRNHNSLRFSTAKSCSLLHPKICADVPCRPS